MFGDKQDQTVGSSSVAVQAGGNVNIIGLALSDVRELVQLFLDKNFPVLREEAKAAAEAHVKAFLAKLENKIIDSASDIDPARFGDPDVQAAMNDAVMASARKGDSANPEILCDLIVDRISNSPSEFKDIVLSEAIQVAPKLTSAQIAMLALVHAVYNMGIPDEGNLMERLEVHAQKILPLCKPAEGISYVQRSHAEYTGACSIISGAFAINLFLSFGGRYPRFEKNSDEEIKKILRNEAPTFFYLIEQMERDKLANVNLTSVGRAIAIARLTAALGKLDYSTWIN